MPSCHLTLRALKPLPDACPAELVTLGDHIRKRRLDLGLLQKDVADELGVDRNTVVNWETNLTSPRLRYTPRIIDFLGYDPLETEPEGLIQALASARRRLGLSRRNMAPLLGVHANTLGCWERMEREPSKASRRRLADLLARLD